MTIGNYRLSTFLFKSRFNKQGQFMSYYTHTDADVTCNLCNYMSIITKRVTIGRIRCYDNKPSAICRPLPSTSQHEHDHLTGFHKHCPHTFSQNESALLLLLAPAFNFTRVGQVMALAFCGRPTHMVDVAISGTWREMWAGGDRQTAPGTGHCYREACVGLVMTAVAVRFELCCATAEIDHR